MCNRSAPGFFFMMFSMAFAALLFIACERLDIVKVVKIETLSVEYVSADTAVCNGNVLDDGGESIIERGICWNTLSNPTIDNPHAVNENETSSFSCILRELQPGTGYHARAYARNEDWYILR